VRTRNAPSLNPRAVAMWSMAAIAIVVLTNNPVYRGLVALVAVNLLVARRRPGVSLRALTGFLGAFALVTILYNPLISHAGEHALLRLPEAIPGIGGPITLESVVFGVSAAVGIVAAALAVAPLMLLLDPTDLLDVMPVALHGVGTALAASLNLVPAVARSFRRVREAEALRGGRRRGPGALLAVIVPVALTTIESSITLAEAMEARAYGSGPRTHQGGNALDWVDRAVIASAAAGAAVVLAARLAGAPLDWYPFPTVTVPGVNPVVAAACLLLSAPLLMPYPRRVSEQVGALA
jgi:energy-coupling factor transport system permease protein